MRDLVVIGGSLGDMKTLCRLIDHLPSPFRAPILAVPADRHLILNSPGVLGLAVGARGIGELLRRLVDGEEAPL